MMRSNAPANRLAAEASPYLLQHADNPVRWYPWCKEAFEDARRADRPVFLSVGYSTCHWCHVMAHESFEDPETARILNEAFVCVKVDREERPDIDRVYMDVCQLLTGSGGWPLTIVMTPDQEPFFAGTYIPRTARLGRLGLHELVPRIVDAWRNRRSEVVASAREIAGHCARDGAESSSPGDLDWERLTDAAFSQLRAVFDPENGGFGSAPKFPSPHNLLFLLRYWSRTGNSDALHMACRTLDAMSHGGIWDHLGYGFHRYSTDASWLVPHFEKMLYDQALMAMAYTEAWQATGTEAYRVMVDRIVGYVLRDLTSPEGAFYSAEDADSEGREGKFYLWTLAEIEDALSPEDAAIAARYYGVQPAGNFPDHSGESGVANILHEAADDDRVGSDLRLGAGALAGRLAHIRRALLAAREKRVRPSRDDKVLTDWNGLMIAALAKASAAFEQPDYAAAASRAARFVLARLRRGDGSLLHRFRNGNAGIDACLDDYAFLAWGLIELYECTFDPDWLEAAGELTARQTRQFLDDGDGGCYFTAAGSEPLIARTKAVHDGAVPSGNSVALLNLLRLGRLLGDTVLEQRASDLAAYMSRRVGDHPASGTAFMCGLSFALGPETDIVLAGDREAADTRALIGAIATRYIPGKTVLLNPVGTTKRSPHALPVRAAAYVPVGGKAAAYVCRNRSCLAPVTQPAELLRILGDVRIPPDQGARRAGKPNEG